MPLEHIRVVVSNLRFEAIDKRRLVEQEVEEVIVSKFEELMNKLDSLELVVK